MLFNSLAFAIFLPIVFFTYWLVPPRWRWVQLLAVSYYFYMSWNAKYVFLILFTTALSYGCARGIERAETKAGKKRLLWLMLAGSLGLLFLFKYFNFVFENINALLQIFALPVSPIVLQLILPVGISFYTFQTLGYVIDVYRGDIPAERNFGQYAAFISFFPQLVAGPIERAKDLLPQIKATHAFCYAQAVYGLRRMAWGFFKKIVVADGMAWYVDVVYNSPEKAHGFGFFAATFFFAIQIYCDFSGYSDIAQGTAKLFGIELMTNFNSPYFAGSVREFWSRWHISLSGWLRDYVYIPLGGNRCGRLRHARNLMVTFLVSGLWHGAAWTYILWGALHGVAQTTESVVPCLRTPAQQNRPIVRWLRTLLTFCFCTATWAVFRANSLGDLVNLVRGAFVGLGDVHRYFSDAYALFGFFGQPNKPFLIVGLILALGVFDYAQMRGYDLLAKMDKLPVVVRCIISAVFIIGMFWMLPGSQYTDFIYFRF